MKIIAIIPAHNEEQTIADVIKAAKGCSLLSEIIVVDDGSSDRTADIAKGQGVKVIVSPVNFGKGQALQLGTKNANGDLFLFLDADLINLKPEHLNQLIEPVLNKDYDMSVGAVDRSQISNILNKLFQKVESPFSGMRVIKRSFWESVPSKYKKGFYVESAITYLAKKRKLKVFPLVLDGVRHVTKEKKLGFIEGTKQRWLMNFQIIFINLALRLKKANG